MEARPWRGTVFDLNTYLHHTVALMRIQSSPATLNVRDTTDQSLKSLTLVGITHDTT